MTGSNPYGGAVGTEHGGTGGSATADGGGAPDQAGSGGAATGVGAITLVQIKTSDGVNYAVSASFNRALTMLAPDGDCTQSKVGACMTNVCTVSGTPNTPEFKTLDAGILTVTGAGTAKATLMFAPDSATSLISGYSGAGDKSRFYSGGDSIVVVGAGGVDLPAFSAQTVIAPNDIVITQPACAGKVCPAIDRTKDLALAWTGGGAGTIRVVFDTIDMIDSSHTHTAKVFCDFDAASGTGTVPKAALLLLGDTRDGVTTGLEFFGVLSEKLFTVGDIPTTLMVDDGSVSHSSPIVIAN